MTPNTTRDQPPRPRLWADVLLAVATLILLGGPSLLFIPDSFLPEFFLFSIQEFFGAADAGSAVIIIRVLINLGAVTGMPLAFIWRASAPVTSTSIIAALALAHYFTGLILMPVDLIIFASLYSLTVYAPPRYSQTGLVVALLGGLLVSLSFTMASGENLALAALFFWFLLSTTLVLLSWGAGLLRRSRREQRESLRERAIRLERERDQQAQIATVAERNRIAREMHDIVAHSLSVVVAQADGGRYAATADPTAAVRALETISEASRAALADMRRILGVLREEDTDTADVAPQPMDSDLDTLIINVRAAGLPVSRVTTGTPKPLPLGAGLAIYRIVQESLTNILKHGGPGAQAIVTTQWSDVSLSVIIDDDGRGAASRTEGGGHGLVGMAERAQMLGGTIQTGPKPGGGFRVHLNIPLPR